MYRLRTFGGLILERDGVPTDEIVAHRKALALLAILAVQETMGRERLMALLWPESDPERARGSLKQAIHTLRRQLSEPELLVGTAELRLNPERIECDTQLFLRALDRGDAEEAVSLHRGPFLEGVHLDGTPDFERWVDGWRDEFAARHRGALESLAVGAEVRGDAAAAVDWWRRLQGADPFSSRTALKLMEALDRAGDPAAALRHARVHETLLREELSVAPDAAVIELAARIRAGAGPSKSAAPPASIHGVEADRAAMNGGPGGVARTDGSVGPGGPGRPAPEPATTPRSSRRRPALLASLVLLLAAVAVGTVISSGRPVGPTGTDDLSAPPSVAVLPLVNMSADGELDYLADGIAEEILNTLASIPGIRVSARTSSFYFRGQNRPIGEIAERLGVDHVLEGSLRADGDQIRVTAQLIDARSDRHIWSRTFDSDFADVFAVQEEIARTVAAALRVRLTPPRIDGTRAVAADPAAHDLYLRGLFHWNRRSAPDLLLAIRFFEEATELDPGYARPWAGLALVYAVVPIGFAPPLGTDVARARLELAADRALALDSTLAEVHAARGLSYHFEWRWDDAEREYLKAIELNPRYATAHQWYAEHLAKVGRGAEAVASIRRALALDPLSLVIQNDLGLVLLLDRQYAAARDAWEEALRMDPSFVIPHYFLHRLALIEGRLADAEESGRRWVALSGAATGDEVATLTRAVGEAGLRAEAIAILDGWASAPAPRWHDIAFYRTYLGASDAAIDALEAGVRAGAPMMAQIGQAPWMDPLRANPRFAVLVRQLAFPE